MATESDAVRDKALREHLLYLLKSGGAHASFDAAVKGLPVAMRGQSPPGAEHSPWEILEHLRLAQWDILEFSRNPKHTSPEWPSGYWPKTQAPPTRGVEQERGSLSSRSQSYVPTGSAQINESIRAYPARRWSDDFAGSVTRRRP
jgi:hypothetical protein